jgi:4-hydroxythreonine-4-phosphate dehydrogenase
MSKPIIAMTLGDPAGIGPELLVKVLSDAQVYDKCRPVVVGDVDTLYEMNQLIGSHVQFQPCSDPVDAPMSPGTVGVIRPDCLEIGTIPWGRVDAAMGQVVALCMKTAFELAMAGKVQGIVAAPMNKESFHRAGYDYFDELAYMADLTNSRDPFILGACGTFWTVTVTEHIAFKDIVSHVKRERVLSFIEKMQVALQRLGYAEPHLAVAALNPHGGEGGLFGRKEIDEIAPAVHQAIEQRMHVVGPVPADTVFVRALAGEFDGVVSMYHDQANIARKLQPRSVAATLFMGLPVVCGTTAHGTAFDLVRKGLADPGSLSAVVDYVTRMATD